MTPPPGCTESHADVSLRTVAPGHAVLELRGELDLHRLAPLERAVRELPGRAARLTVALEGATFAGVAALALVVDALRTVALEGGRAEVVGASPLHGRVLRLLGVPPDVVVRLRAGVPGPRSG